MFSTVQDWSNITDRESISKYLPFRDFETNTGILQLTMMDLEY